MTRAPGAWCRRIPDRVAKEIRESVALDDAFEELYDLSIKWSLRRQKRTGVRVTVFCLGVRS